MRFYRPTFEDKVAEAAKWKRVFAWFPARVGKHEYRWLEWVEFRTLWEHSPSQWGDYLLHDFYRKVGDSGDGCPTIGEPEEKLPKVVKFIAGKAA